MGKEPEVWLRGELPGIPALLQPVAHALLQAREELTVLMDGFPEALLWETPVGMASPAFHLQHIRGVLDRLFTYAAGRQLDKDQYEFLQKEGLPYPVSAQALMQALSSQVDYAIETLKKVDAQDLTAVRGVGRQRIPSTVIGLYVHAAEHTMRHTGQLLVTAAVLKAGVSKSDSGTTGK